MFAVHRLRRFSVVCLVAASAVAAFSERSNAADEPQEKRQQTAKAVTSDDPGFVRLRRDADDNPLALETAVVRYAPPGDQDGTTFVDLVGVIHVAEAPYYDDLNKRFESYDAVLYELVAPEGTRIPKGGRSGAGGHPVGWLQLSLTKTLDLAFQLDEIDYTKKNLIHADMSPNEFAETMKERGESFTQMFFRMLGHGIAAQSSNPTGSSDMQMMLALLSGDRSNRLKRLMAEQFEDVESQMIAIEGPDGSTIITERNKKALQVLKRELGRGKKRIAVFYGAGHLADMAQRLEADFKLQRQSTEWLEAWKLADDDQAQGKVDKANR